MLNSPHRILITGANGFIGSALTRYLMEVGYGERLSLAVRKGFETTLIPTLSGTLILKLIGLVP